MTALSMDRKTDQLGTPDIVLPQLLSFPVAADTIIYGGALVALDASGNAVPASSTAALRCVGRCEKVADNRTLAHGGPGAGTAGLTQVSVHQGVFYFNSGTGVDLISAARMQLCFASDDNTVNATDSGGTRPVVGPVYNVRSDGQVGVLVGFPSLFEVDPELLSSFFTARAVATSIQAYAGTGTGALTESANAALAAQDGITIAVGDTIFFPHGLSNVQDADVGPWVVTALGGASSKWSLVRPNWWVHGAPLPLVAEIKLGPSGTVWKNSTWKSTTTGTIDTTDALFYPLRIMGSGAVGTQVTGLYALSTAQVSAVDKTAAAAVKAVLVAGNGNGTLDFTGTGTDAISWIVSNF